jgi:quercetin dioxygenase-like cupin family protein
MKVTKISDVKGEDKSADTIFTGGTVKIQFLTGTGIPDHAKEPEPLAALQVNFSRGARTVFHVHDHPQILYVTKGKGIVATEKEEIEVTEGTLVLFPAGENHWHGATKDSEFSHISITTPGKTTWEGKK